MSHLQFRNLGLISWLLMRCLRDAGFADDEVDTVHVTEYDTHVLRADCKESNGTFYNTWSPFGLHEEARKKSEMAWYGPVPAGWVPDGHLITHSLCSGFEVCLQSVTPRWTSQTTWEFARYSGFVITHGEVETISYRLGRNIKCAFVYHTCPDATESMQHWQQEHALRCLSVVVSSLCGIPDMRARQLQDDVRQQCGEHRTSRVGR